MRVSRVQITMRQMMVAIAVVAVTIGGHTLHRRSKDFVRSILRRG